MSAGQVTQPDEQSQTSAQCLVDFLAVLHLGKADIVKHEIQFTNDTLFKEPFQIISLALYEEV